MRGNEDLQQARMVTGNQPMMSSQLIDNPWVVFAGNRHILFHATQALTHYGVPTTSTILVIATSDPRIRAQVQEVVRPTDWRIVYDPFKGVVTKMKPYSVRAGVGGIPIVRWVRDLSRLRRAIQRIRVLAREYPHIGGIISGIYAAEIDRTFANLVMSSKYILVDDGNMTRLTASGRKAEAAIDYERVLGVNSHRAYAGIRGKLKVTLLRQYAGVIDRGSEAVDFFTTWDKEIVGPRDHVITNRYPNRPVKGAVVMPGVVHFLGLPALSRNILSNDDFRNVLRQVRDRYEGRRILYFAHPVEGSAEREVVASVWPEAEWHDNTAPYESILLQSKERPEVISTFYSSVLMNLVNAALGDIRFESFQLPLSMIQGDRRKTLISPIYDALMEIDGGRIVIVEVW